nr:uncharacterized protein LOC111502820 [Leptinotarsa decemlineata]
MQWIRLNQSGFPTPDNINRNEFQNEVSNILHLFVSWLIDAKLFEEAEYGKTSELAAIPSNTILGLFDKCHRRNSFHVGLDLHQYHHIPSKHILDTLSSLGLTCSYNEVRQVTTSLAKQEIDDRGDVYVPKFLGQVSNEKNNYIRASIDNFDLNEETFDGKRTTHAMAMVVFQEKQFSQPIRERIKEGSSALSKEETDISLQKIEKYVKPKTRPVPSEFEFPTIIRKNSIHSTKINMSWRLLKFLQNEYSFMGWSDFQNILSHNNIPLSTISYLPFLNAPPIEFDTIFTAMLRLVQLVEKLNQDHIVHDNC